MELSVATERISNLDHSISSVYEVPANTSKYEVKNTNKSNVKAL